MSRWKSKVVAMSWDEICSNPPATLVAVAFFLLWLVLLYSDLLLGTHTPMGGDKWTLRDPAVSWAVFLPSFREFKYELFENGNLLWSAGRGFGLPILGNSVQTAPLFPLNGLLIWLPDSLYWTVMPLARLFLIYLGAFFLAHRIFRFSIFASLLFALFFGLNLNVLRWLNHPWENGILAGIWYIYFCARMVEGNRTPFLLCAGVIVSIFALITCGFPEAAAVSALLALFIIGAMLIHQFCIGIKRFWIVVGALLLCHVIGIALATIQIFPLLEFIEYSRLLELREGFISGTYESSDMRAFALAQTGFYSPTDAQYRYILFYVGMFGLFFFVRGIILRAFVPGMLKYSIPMLGLMGLFVSKSFGISATLEEIFSVTPVLAHSHFVTYFSPLFYLGIAFFIGLGADSCMKTLTASTVKDWLVSLLSGLLVFWVMNTFLAHFHQLSLVNAVFREGKFFYPVVLFAATWFFLLMFPLVARFTAGKTGTWALQFVRTAPILILAFVLLELNYVMPRNFKSVDNFRFDFGKDYQSLANQLEENSPVPPIELRTHDANGKFASIGLSTINNGISAMLPADQRLLRTRLFRSTYGGYFPIEQADYRHAWNLTSVNTALVNVSSKSITDWDHLQFSHEASVKLHPSMQEIVLRPTAAIYVEGKTQGWFMETASVRPTVRIYSASHDLWLDGKMEYKRILRKFADRSLVEVKWSVRFPIAWLNAKDYSLLVRLSNAEKYGDSNSIAFGLADHANNISQERDLAKMPDLFSAEAIAEYEDDDWALYFNKDALPRAYRAKGCEMVQNEQEALERIRDPSILGTVVVASSEASNELPCDSYHSDLSRIAVQADQGSSLELESITGPALLVLNDYFYPGWQAFDVDSAEQFPIYRSNLIFRSIYLPENKNYKIAFQYRPAWMPYVYYCWVLAFMLTLVLWCFLSSKRDFGKHLLRLKRNLRNQF